MSFIIKFLIGFIIGFLIGFFIIGPIMIKIVKKR